MSEDVKEVTSGGQGIIARLASRNRGLRDANKAMATELQEAKDKLKAANGQLEQLKASSDPQGLATKVKELQAELRHRDHKTVFAKLAKAAGVREDGLDDLYSLSGYKPEADQADETAVTALIAEQKTKRGYLFAPAGSTTAAAAAGETPKPGPAGGKGGTSTSGAPQISEDLVKNDPAYVMRNYAAIQAAAKAAVAARALA